MCPLQFPLDVYREPTYLKYAPDFIGALFILAGLLVAEILVATGFYDAGVVFTPGDPRAFVIVVLGNGIVFSILMHLSGLTYRDLFHPAHVTLATTLKAYSIPVLLVVVGALWWFSELSWWFISFFAPNDTTDLDALQNMLQGGLATVIFVGLIGPVIEEMLFRGIILRGFITHYTPPTAILLSAILFAAIHMNIYQIPVALLFGWFLGWVYFNTRSLLPCILGHSAYNLGTLTIVERSGATWNVATFLVSCCGLLLLAALFRTARERGQK